MVNQELVDGLRNAIERGNDLEKVKQSFISAGYHREQVEEAAEMISYGSSLDAPQENEPKPNLSKAVKPGKTEKLEKTIPEQPTAPEKSPQMPQLAKDFQTPQADSKEMLTPEKEEKSKTHLWIILLLSILFFLIIALVLILVFKDQIIGWFS